jgi:hypothetical protein
MDTEELVLAPTSRQWMARRKLIPVGRDRRIVITCQNPSHAKCFDNEDHALDATSVVR